MKLNIKKSIPEYEIKKEGSMFDVAVQEIGKDEVVVSIILNASIEINLKKPRLK